MIPVPPGWRLVPEEPTEEMVKAFEGPFGRPKAMLRAAIAAAPQPPAPYVPPTPRPAKNLDWSPPQPPAPAAVDTSREAIARLAFDLGLGDILGVGRRVVAALGALQARAEKAEAERDAANKRAAMLDEAMDDAETEACSVEDDMLAANARIARLEAALREIVTTYDPDMMTSIAREALKGAADAS